MFFIEGVVQHAEFAVLKWKYGRLRGKVYSYELKEMGLDAYMTWNGPDTPWEETMDFLKVVWDYFTDLGYMD